MMPRTAKLSDEEEAYFGGHSRATAANRPWVTLTWAQSLDGMIAGRPGTQTYLSGIKSKAATHLLRSVHSAILVGGRTAQVDDPSLNCRYPGKDRSPRPVILDPSRVWQKPEKSTVLRLANDSQASFPLVVRRSDDSGEEIGWPMETVKIEANATIPDGRKHIKWDDILAALHERHIGSIMIEGGASIIRDLLKRPDLVDEVIITIAPTFIGEQGVPIAPKGSENPASLKNVRYLQLGDDMMMTGQLSGSSPRPMPPPRPSG
ncbi:unnamed protein product [Zymoseptoria tritici ST99CH_3D1]|uniref:2,5-diamino-6-ribosylamino-4(3H)-pyrimidinone 5'-phosphate reductase n=3 Tax=Zymoseptoria tritici TaxID=1047171 RepID=A0A1X7RBX4_ZYMT9|nr:unnamed protein product [Zymoseptoria tritici ST99CH_3D7]SMR41290.1 unnamed protein product [Zymoseptoria tritici ST99CH_1E4]SMR43492.1 unnamed protein product [Zymoseptoria tritici ST99CH_3D1]